MQVNDEVQAGVGLRRALLREEVAGAAVDPDGERGGIGRGIAARQEPAEEARQDVPAPAFRQARIAGRIDQAFPIGGKHFRMESFHHERAAGGLAKIPHEAVSLRVAVPGQQAPELTQMRREHRTSRQVLLPLGHFGKDIQRIGI